MGSVKDLETVRQPTSDSFGKGRFHFSDRYSVFDWGAMPDEIRHKGAALCIMGAHCFDQLERKHIRTHYKGLIDEIGKLVSLDELDTPTNIMEIRLVNVLRPVAISLRGELKYDYTAFSSDLRNYLIPLEIIYRNGVTEGSSILKRLQQGLVTIEELGLDHFPSPGERFSNPIFDVSTKLEEKDRYVSWREAQRIAGLTYHEVDEIKRILRCIDDVITETASRADLQNIDGKIELAFSPDRELLVVDVVGTLDECRFMHDSMHISKELARRYFRTTAWFTEVEEAKKRSAQMGVQDWRALCNTSPPSMDPSLNEVISNVYMAAANELTRRRFFDVPRLEDVIAEYESLQFESGHDLEKSVGS